MNAMMNEMKSAHEKVKSLKKWLFTFVNLNFLGETRAI